MEIWANFQEVYVATKEGDNKIENWIDVIYGWPLRHSGLLSAAQPNFELIL